MPRRYLTFDKLILKVADRFGIATAASWTKAVLAYQRQINMVALETAIASRNVNAIAAVVGPDQFQAILERELQRSLTGIAATTGTQVASYMTRAGIGYSFNAVHPNVVLYARTQAAQLVVGVAQQTKQIIAEVVARGASGLLTVDDQARAIREVVGLPPQWAQAPRALADELNAGDHAAATNRKMSGALQQQIRSRIMNGTVTPSFVSYATEQYAAALISLRAKTIARTESLRAAHFGLNESWKQAKSDGLLPDSTRRFWIVTPDDRLCPICVEIPGMNPDGVGLDELFLTPDGPVDYPPAPHPNCRCSVALGFPT